MTQCFRMAILFPTPPATDGARPRGSARHAARHRRDAHLHAGRHAGHGQGAHARACSATPARRSSSATPITSPCGPATSSSRELGGLHRSWTGTGRSSPTPAGSRSSASRRRCKITDHGAQLPHAHRRPPLELTPERAVAIQENLGSDIAMCLDECPPGDIDAGDDARGRRRTIRWAERCKRAPHASRPGAVRASCRAGPTSTCAASAPRQLVALDFPGYALGGFSVGEAPEAMHAALPACAGAAAGGQAALPHGRRPAARTCSTAVAAGIDLFDCVMPTRNGRNALAFTDGRPDPAAQRQAPARFGPGGVRLRLLLLRELSAGVPAPPVPGRRDARADAADSAQRRVLPAVDAQTPGTRSGGNRSPPSMPVALPAGRRDS